MMGRSHATSGAVLALVALPVLHSFGMEYTPIAVATFMVGGAAGAMLPDFDHHSATIAHSLWPVSKWMAQGIEKISGGHRNGTHSILGWLIFTAFAFVIGQVGPGLLLAGVPAAKAHLAGQIVMGCWMAFLFAIATTALRLKPPSSNFGWSVMCLAGGVGLAFANLLTHAPTDILAIGVSIGVLAHLLGDMLTKEGCPLLYPWNRYRFHYGNITTDHFTERVIIGPGLGVLAIILAMDLLGWWAPVVTAATKVVVG